MATTKTNRAVIWPTYHAKRQKELYVVTFSDFVGRPAFLERKAAAIKSGGFYMRAWQDEPGGFAFETADAAMAFAAYYAGDIEQIDAAPTDRPARAARPAGDADRPAKQADRPADDGRAIARAVRFREMAAKLRTNAAKLRERPSRLNTPRQNKQFNERLYSADCDENTAAALEALADAWQAGQVPPLLRNLTNKKAIAPLVSCWRDYGSAGYYGVIWDRHRYDATTPEAKALQSLISDRPASQASQAAAEDKQVRELRALSIPGYFPTPPETVESMITRAGIHPNGRPVSILEPSAGDGAIIRALVDRFADGVRVSAVEASPDLRAHLESTTPARVLDACDFLELSADGPAGRLAFDRVLMNPPFERGQDCEHVRHAYDMLADGGKLVAIMSPAFEFRTCEPFKSFRRWITDEAAAGWAAVENLPDGWAKASGTGTAGRLVTIHKPPIEDREAAEDEDAGAADPQPWDGEPEPEPAEDEDAEPVQHSGVADTPALFSA
jgi:predicted RNA methylase